MQRRVLNVRTSAICSACLLLLVHYATAAPVTVGHATVELISETASVQPGSRASLGIKFVHEPHWHTYWINPGDSGLQTQLTWQLPPGFNARMVDWPAPHRFDIGGLYNFGYDSTVLLPVSIDVAATAHPNTTAHLVVNAKWLICNDQCIPGKAALSIDLPVATGPAARDATTSSLFAAARAAQPKPKAWQGHAQIVGDKVRIELRGADLPAAVDLDVFPVATKLVNNVRPTMTRAADRLTIETEKSDYFDVVPKNMELVLVQKSVKGSERSAWQVTVPWLNDTKSPASGLTKSTSR